MIGGSFTTMAMAMAVQKQKTITLSERAEAEFSAIADWKGLPLARLLGQYLEVIHQSQEFQALLERAKKDGFTFTDDKQG